MATEDTSIPVPFEREQSTAKQLKKFLSRNFYLVMSLLMAGLVVWGVDRRVGAKSLHASPPRPVLLWFYGVFSAWVVLFIAQSSMVRR